jgi:glutathione S-transferase
MIIIHHLNNSRSQRILWMCEEIGVDYQVKKYKRNKKTQLAPKSLMKIHPLGKSPVISDGDRNIAESGVILEYLAENYGSHLIPKKSSEQYWQYKYWLHFAEGSLMPQLLLKLIFDKIKSTRVPFFIKPITHKIANKVLDDYILPNVMNFMVFIESHLGNNEWFAGDEITAADIMMSFPLEASMARIKKSNYPNIDAWVKKIHLREGYKKALKVGGPYEFS